MTIYRDSTVLRNAQDVVNALNIKFDLHYEQRLLFRIYPIRAVAILFNPEFNRKSQHRHNAKYNVQIFLSDINNIRSYYNYECVSEDGENRIFTKVLSNLQTGNLLNLAMPLTAQIREHEQAIETYDPNMNIHVRFSAEELGKMKNTMENCTHKVAHNKERLARYLRDFQIESEESSEDEVNNDLDEAELAQQVQDYQNNVIDMPVVRPRVVQHRVRRRDVVPPEIHRVLPARPAGCYDETDRIPFNQTFRDCKKCVVYTAFENEADLMTNGVWGTVRNELQIHNHPASRIARKNIRQAIQELLAHYKYGHW
jgi:hypothetical protein